MAGCKFKVGGLSPPADAQRVDAARKAAGPDFIPAVDANRGWTADEAIHFAILVEPLDIRWFEEPCHWYDDAAQMARVRARTRIPINAGQCEITSHGVRRLIDANAVDIVNYDASEGGWGDRLAPRSRAMCDGRRGDGASRGVTNRAAFDVCDSPRHLHRVAYGRSSSPSPSPVATARRFWKQSPALTAQCGMPSAKRLAAALCRPRT
jgi:hypothetical protein